jgi:chromosome segregation ATPase
MRNAAYIVLTFFGLCCASCISRGAVVDRTVLEHQRQVAELEARNQDLERRLATFASEVGDIRSRSVGMEGEVDEIISLFDQYQRAVDKLIEDYRSAATQTGE